MRRSVADLQQRAEDERMDALRGLVEADAGIEVRRASCRARRRSDAGVARRRRGAGGQRRPAGGATADGPSRRITSSASRFRSASRLRASSGVSRSTSRPQPLDDRVGLGRRLKQGELPLFGAPALRSGSGRPPRCSSSFSSDLRISEARRTTAARQAREPGDLDAVAAIGSARHDLVQEDDVVA